MSEGKLENALGVYYSGNNLSRLEINHKINNRTTMLLPETTYTAHAHAHARTQTQTPIFCVTNIQLIG